MRFPFLPVQPLYTVFVDEEETKLETAPERPPQPAWRQLFKTTEGRILLPVIAIAPVGLIVMVLVAIWSPKTTHITGAMAFFNIIFGRAVSISIGHAGGFDHSLVIR